MEMTEIVAIVTAGSTALGTLGVLPYVFAGAIIGVVVRLVTATKKAAK